MSGFWAVPRMYGRSGESPRPRWSRTSSTGTSARSSSSETSSIVFSSCEVRKPSKKCTNGTRDSSVAACATAARSCASCTDAEHSRAKPVWRAAITSEWSPKIESPWAASERAATWNTAGVSSPAILYMLGIISSRPCEAVNVVVRAPVCSAPCSAPAAPPSLCISTTVGTWPHTLRAPLARPLVGQLGHRRGGCDRVDAADLVQAVRGRCGGLVAVDGRAHQTPSGVISMACTGHCS